MNFTIETHGKKVSQVSEYSFWHLNKAVDLIYVFSIKVLKTNLSKARDIYVKDLNKVFKCL